ncbi:MAG TPA: hypothetical protein VFI17_12380 [Solirubrobacterales bacterium]|nr:hypothetical protein [Solirubrobacterales bacterium]
MKAQTQKKTNVIVAAMVVVAALAIAFWMLLLSPKREEAQKLDKQVKSLESLLAQHRSEAEVAAAARRSFSGNYERLVVLGKAVPGGDETASLLVQLDHLAAKSEVSFQTLALNGGGGNEEEAAPEGAAVSPTEAEASLLPLGASIGPAGLGVMPYSLTFEGDFFQVAKFIESLDNLVKTSNENVAVNGRLITVNSFSLAPADSEGESSAKLQANFSVTTFLTPPGQGLTAGATPAGPEAEPATLTSTTTGAAP